MPGLWKKKKKKSLDYSRVEQPPWEGRGSPVPAGLVQLAQPYSAAFILRSDKPSYGLAAVTDYRKVSY